VLIQTAVRSLVCRCTARPSSLVATIVIIGILVRITAGLGLFWISFYDSSILRGLHSGDGFWQLAPDARAYYLSAASAIEHGLGSIPHDTVSPTYVRVLALWMMVAGVSPASGFLLNLVCYLLTCGMLAAAFRSLPEPWRQRARLFTITALTCSPALIVFGTQPLKDTFVVFLAVLAAVGASEIAWSVASPRAFAWHCSLRGAAAILVALYLVAGIRAYYAFIIWSCLVLMFVACFIWQGRSAVWRGVVVAPTTLVVAWIAFAAGAGAAAEPYRRLIALDRGAPGAAAMVTSARTSYVGAGGATNIAWADTDAGRPVSEHAHALMIGVAALFVPVSVLRGLSIVEFEGGRNLLVFTDIDTLFLDLTLAIGLVLLVRGWPALRHNLAYVIFAASLTLILIILTAYVVTNYGTLVRLRLMMAIPVWTIPLAMRGAGAVGDAADPPTR
jgi:hypothetical protein